MSDLPKEIQNVGGGTGLDLAASEDWASLGLAYDLEGILNVWAKIWVSWGWIEEHNHRAEFQKWAQDGWITPHDGEAVDFDEVEADVLEILRWTRSACLGYDKMFGMQMAQNLQKKLPRVGIYKFAQSVENYAVGTAELKAAMKNDRLRQPGNPAIDWQASHVKSKIIGNYEKPVKDEDSPWKKVDTIQAIIMAIDVKRYLQPPPQPYLGIV
jgi:phage terminase large subunit-like protein